MSNPTHRLEVTMNFVCYNKAQAKFIIKQLNRVRDMTSKLGMTHSSNSSTLIRKIEN